MSPPLFDRVLPDAIARAENLPALPAVAARVLELARDEDAGLDEYARVLSSDAALAERLLRLANSSLFSLGQEVTTIDRATMVLGMKTVQLMALAFSLARELPREGSAAGFDYEEYWRRSLTTAVAGRELGRVLGFTLADEAFLCGLLSDVGRLVLAECLPDEYEAVLRESGGWPTHAEERRHLGFDHSDVGAALLRSWNVPAPLCLALASQEDPTELPPEAGKSPRKLAEILHLARLAVALLREGDKGESLRALHAAAARVGLTRERIDTLILAMELRLAETSDMFELDLGRSSHFEVLDEARREMLRSGLAAVAEDAERVGKRTEDRRHREREAEDELTGLGTRAWFDALLARELRLRAEQDVPSDLGVLLIEPLLDEADADPSTVEAVQRSLGHTLRGLSRISDAPARLDATRLAVLVSGGDVQGLRLFGERIARATKGLEALDGRRTLPIELAVGVSALSALGAGASAETLLEAALGALDRARSGPERVVLAPG